jgi:hypothetical protein
MSLAYESKILKIFEILVLIIVMLFTKINPSTFPVLKGGACSGLIINLSNIGAGKNKDCH